MTRTTTAIGTALALIMCAAATGGASAASVDQKFSAALTRMLLNIEDGAVGEMTKQEKQDLAVCVNGIFGKISQKKKLYILEASDPTELRARFKEVGLEDRARLEKQVTQECA